VYQAAYADTPLLLKSSDRRINLLDRKKMPPDPLANVPFFIDGIRQVAKPLANDR
jgi:hypothetical protein